MLRNNQGRLKAGLAMSIGLLSSMALAVPPGATVRGEIKSFTTAPKGEVDGAMFADGSYVHWPPHVGERVAKIVKIGDSLEAAGQWETGPQGDRRFEAENVTNVGTKASVEVDGPRRGGPRRNAEARRGETTAKVGHVRELTTAPKGELDGAVLDDGTVLHWPPHLERRFRTIVATGAEVRAVGMNEVTPKGDSHFEVQSLTNLDTNQTAVNDGGPRPPRGPRAEQGAAGRNREDRIRALQRQLDQIQHELDELRRSE